MITNIFSFSLTEISIFVLIIFFLTMPFKVRIYENHKNVFHIGFLGLIWGLNFIYIAPTNQCLFAKDDKNLYVLYFVFFGKEYQIFSFEYGIPKERKIYWEEREQKERQKKQSVPTQIR